MNKWVRRLLYGLAILLWLAFMSLPFLAFTLARQGQLQLGSGGGANLRLFMVQEEDANGIGATWTRSAGRQSSCTRTSLAYFLWEGQAENASYCQCYDVDNNLVGATCPN
jgi:hypothetical protein